MAWLLQRRFSAPGIAAWERRIVEALLAADLDSAAVAAEVLSADLVEVLAELLGEDPSTDFPDEWIELLQDISTEMDAAAAREKHQLVASSNIHLDQVMRVLERQAVVTGDLV